MKKVWVKDFMEFLDKAKSLAKQIRKIFKKIIILNLLKEILLKLDT